MIHPGPRSAERMHALCTDLIPIKGVLPAGQNIMQAIGDLFAAHGCKGGMVLLNGAICNPMRYVLPALSTDGLHAAWYSGTHAPNGRWTIQSATASIGQKDDAPFLHCHGIWSDGQNTAMGHLLPFDTLLADDAHVVGLGSRDTWFESLPDAETAFTLFTPSGGGNGQALFARVLPNEDMVTAIEALAARHQIIDADLYAVGSIDHINFTDGNRVDCIATELHFTGAEIVNGAAHIPIEVVDIDGNIACGVLERGTNPVGVTLELIIDPERKIHD